MTLAFFATCAAWLLFEVGMAVGRRSDRQADRRRDAGTLGNFWRVIPIACSAGGLFSALRAAPFPTAWQRPALALGTALVLAGLALRVAAILTLRRLFTVDVAIREGHQLVTRGLYAVVRHPSYAGSLLSFLGLGIALGSFASLATVVLPITWAFVRRIQAEEQALAEAFGEAWTDYAARTARLLPGAW